VGNKREPGAADRFRRRKRVRERMAEGTIPTELPTQEQVDRLLQSPVDQTLVDAILELSDRRYHFEPRLEVSDVEARELLDDMRGSWNQDRRDELLKACRDSVLAAIIKPFGLARILFNDRDGGNVTTRHNARDGVYASEADQDRFERTYDPHEFHVANERYHQRRDELRAAARRGELRDVYNSSRDLSDGPEGRRPWDTEHVVAAKELHEDERVKLFLDEQAGADLANTPENLGATVESLNRSKGRVSLEDWANRPSKEDPSRTNAEVHGIDMDEARRVDQAARARMDKELGRARVRYYGTRILGTGIKEGVKMGVQQALGMLLFELTTAVFDEVKDCLDHGFFHGEDDRALIDELTARLQRVCVRLGARWKDLGKAFVEGSVSGFLSNLVTVVINMFVRTGRRLVRIIREGFFAVMKALHMAVFPPEGMSPELARHEATKLLAAGLAIAGGVLIEEAIDKAIKAAPLLEPLADVLTTVLVGIATGVATVALVHLLEKLDLFGVEGDRRHAFLMDRLDAEIEALLMRGDELVDAMG
jgi:hypothetical protein